LKTELYVKKIYIKMATSQYYNSSSPYYASQVVSGAPSISDKEHKEKVARFKADKSARDEKRAFAESVLKKNALGKLVSYLFQESLAGAPLTIKPSDKVRGNALLFLAKQHDPVERQKKNLPQTIDAWQIQTYIPALGMSGAVGAIADTIASKFLKKDSDHFGNACAHQGLYVAMLANLGSNFFITHDNLIRHHGDFRVKVNPLIESLLQAEMQQDGSVLISDEAKDQFVDHLFAVVGKITALVAQVASQSVNHHQFNSGTDVRNEKMHLIREAAERVRSDVAHEFASFIASFAHEEPVSMWIAKTTDHKKQAVSYMLGYDNILAIGQQIGLIESFTFGGIPKLYKLEAADGKLAGYRFMPNLTDARNAHWWSKSQLLNVVYKPHEKKSSSRVKAGETLSTENFRRILETRFLKYTNEQLNELANGTKFIDPSGFNSTNGTNLGLGSAKETQKLFPGHSFTLSGVNALRNLRDSNSSIEERDSIVVDLLLGSLRTNKRKFPRGNDVPTAEFNTVLQATENVINLLGLNVSQVMPGVSRQQIFERTGY
jgi:hypothetical protein